jgi:hypothetical protein
MRVYQLRKIACCAIVLLGSQNLVYGQTISQLIKGDPLAQYQTVKELVKRYRTSAPLDRKEYWLANCARTGIDFIDDGHEGQALADLALDVIDWSNDLPRLGFPAVIWQPMVASYEQQALHLMHQYVGSHQAWAWDGELAKKLKHHQAEFRRKLAVELNAYRWIDLRQLAEVIPDEEGGCGGGNPGVDLQVHIRPPDGQVFVITAFKFALCKKRGDDPWNRTKCDFWMEAVNDSTINIAGQNKYLARWKDGAVRDGTISDNGKKNGDPFDITKLE